MGREAMATELTWLGHGSWSIKTGDTQVLLDPFLDDSPTAPIKAADAEADFILVSHGHFDHVADAAPIANRTGATIVAIHEIAQWFNTKQSVQNVVGMNLGGSVQLPFGRAKLTLAFHSSELPDGSSGGNPGGFLLSLSDGNIYFACDTALFSDMSLIGQAGIDVAVLPIGDLYTMGPDDALEAVQLIKPKVVVPDHYNTWPPIEQDPNKWADRVRAETNSNPVVIEPGGKLTL
jgi:L-ascorbate metabolism protein UlaG (beta-lactamase superfamily)